MKTANVMLDLETLGNKPNSVILAIGACFFAGGKIHDEFYIRINAESCERHGLRMDASTVLWWLQQNEAARAEVCKPSEVTLREGLEEFAEWIGTQRPKVWGNGSDFDNVILKNAYDHTRLDVPWNFWDNRCYRTVKNLNYKIPFEKTGTAHNALDDAKGQALHLMRIFGEEIVTDETSKTQ